MCPTRSSMYRTMRERDLRARDNRESGPEQTSDLTGPVPAPTSVALSMPMAVNTTAGFLRGIAQPKVSGIELCAGPRHGRLTHLGNHASGRQHGLYRTDRTDGIAQRSYPGNKLTDHRSDDTGLIQEKTTPDHPGQAKAQCLWSTPRKQSDARRQARADNVMELKSDPAIGCVAHRTGRHRQAGRRAPIWVARRAARLYLSDHRDATNDGA